VGIWLFKWRSKRINISYMSTLFVRAFLRINRNFVAVRGVGVVLVGVEGNPATFASTLSSVAL
jgi:hypothetical protein